MRGWVLSRLPGWPSLIGGLQRAAFSLISSLLSMALIVLVQRGYVRSVSWFLVIALWLMTTMSFILGGGIRTGGYSIFLPVVLAIFLLGRGVGLAVTSATIIMGLVLTMAEVSSRLPSPRLFAPLTYWISQSLVIILIALIIELASSSTRWALNRAKTAEASWRTLAQNTPDYIIEVQPDQTIRFLNRTMNDWPTDSVIGQPAQMAVLPALEPALLEVLCETAETHMRTIKAVESRAATAEPLHYQITAVPILRDGQLDVISITIRDVTSQITAQAQRIQLELETEKNTMLQTFISEMSHDFKSPLSSIVLNADMIVRYADPARREEKASNIKEQALRLNSAIQNLLTMAKLDHVTDFDMQPFDLNELVRDKVREFDPLITEKGQDCQMHLDAALPHVCGDRDQVGNALANLIENATRYTPAQGTITIRTYVDTERICVDVADNGIGIPPDEMDRIFDRYFRSANARSAEKTGTGLGLAIVKRIMETHHGAVQVRSTPREGSTFTLRFPNRDAEST